MHVKHDAKMRFSPLVFLEFLKIGCVDVASMESDSVKFLIPNFMCAVAGCFAADANFPAYFQHFFKTQALCVFESDCPNQTVQAERCDCAGLVSRSAG